MKSNTSRREFLSHAAILCAGLPFVQQLQGFASTPAKKATIRFGYSAITWGGNDAQAIKDISSLGFRGIQLRANAYTAYGTKVEELKKMLDDAKLHLAMFSSGNANINTGKDEETIAQHVTHAKFVKALGGSFIQVTNSSRPKDRKPSEDELKQFGKLLTEVGNRVRPLGINVAYHNHMNQLGETPEEVDIILRNTDPREVSFLLDVAHYQQGGGDPASAIRKYKNRLRALHIKDVRDQAPGVNGQKYIFVELGQGRVDFPAVFKALDEIGFKGDAVIELDAVPDKSKTPLECATTSKKYLQDKFSFQV